MTASSPCHNPTRALTVYDRWLLLSWMSCQVEVKKGSCPQEDLQRQSITQAKRMSLEDYCQLLWLSWTEWQVEDWQGSYPQEETLSKSVLWAKMVLCMFSKYHLLSEWVTKAHIDQPTRTINIHMFDVQGGNYLSLFSKI